MEQIFGLKRFIAIFARCLDTNKSSELLISLAKRVIVIVVVFVVEIIVTSVAVLFLVLVMVEIILRQSFWLVRAIGVDVL